MNALVVLTREGLLIVSSPNKRYYAKTRAATGPNPYHQHEFEAEEFVRELERDFSECSIAVTESRGVVRVSSGGKLLAGRGAHRRRRRQAAEDAHFFIGFCSRAELPEPKSFVYVPKAANMLRERENHVEALERQLADIKADRQALLELFRQQTRELEERNQWAQRLEWI